MEKSKVVTVDTFPKYPDKRKVLLYYMVRSTRVTVACCGLRHVLVYADEKRIKTFLLPEELTCCTMINAILSGEDGKGTTRVLLCGSSKGAVFALVLPSNKEALISLKKRSSGHSATLSTIMKEFVTVYKYMGLRITSLSCINAHLVILGRDGEDVVQILLFQPCVLHNALLEFQSTGISSTTGLQAHEKVPLNPPTLCKEDTSLIIFHANGSCASPYYSSLDNVHNLDMELFMALFGTETGGSNTVITCFVYPNGEIWFSSMFDLQLGKNNRFCRLCSIQDTCNGIATILISPEFFEQQLGKPNSLTGSKMGLMMFGAKRGVSIVCEAKNVSPCDDQEFEVIYIPYPSQVKSLISKWSALMQYSDAFISTIDSFVPGINVCSSCTKFLGEQQIGIKSDAVWAFQDFQNHTALMAIRLSELWMDHSFTSSDAGNMKALLSELEELNMHNTDLKMKSDAVTNLLKDFNALIKCLFEKTSFFEIDATVQVLNCSDSMNLCFTIKISDTCYTSVLAPFLCNIQICVKCENTSSGHVHVFTLDDLNSCKELNVCMTMDKDQFENGSVAKMDIFISFLYLKRVCNLPEDTKEILNNVFPLLLRVFDKSFATSILE